MMTKDEEIRSILKKLRQEAHLSQEEMARRLGLKRTTYRKLENGPTKLVSDVIEHAADVFNVPSAQMFGYDLNQITQDCLSDIESELARKNQELSSANAQLEALNNVLSSEVEELHDQLKHANEMNLWLRRRLDHLESAASSSSDLSSDAES